MIRGEETGVLFVYIFKRYSNKFNLKYLVNRTYGFHVATILFEDEDLTNKTVKQKNTCQINERLSKNYHETINVKNQILHFPIR